MESLAHLDAGIDLGEGHTVDDSAWLQAAAGAANESSGSDQDYDQADDQDDEDEGDNEDEELNQRHFGIFKALPVGDGDPDWSLEEPDSAEEYLRRVRFEAARCPQVMRVDPAEVAPRPPNSWRGSDRSGSALVAPPPIADAPDWAKPGDGWVRQFVADFQALRAQVHSAYEGGDYPAALVPHVNDDDGWDAACFGHSAQAEALSMQHSGGAELTQLAPGICAKLMALEQHEAAALFLRHAQQLEEHFPDSLPLLRAQWLFALAARLEKPCTPDVAAGFRALLRHCCRLRAGLTNVADPLLPALNVLIVVAGAYFAQDEQLCSVVDAAELL